MHDVITGARKQHANLDWICIGHLRRFPVRFYVGHLQSSVRPSVNGKFGTRSSMRVHDPRDNHRCKDSAFPA